MAMLNPNVMLGRMFMRTGGALPPQPTAPGGYDSSGINPHGLYTGGPNPPVRVGIPQLPAEPPPDRVPTMRTGGPNPTVPLPRWQTGGPLPPTQTVPRAGGLLTTGGPDMPQRPMAGLPRMPRAVSLPASQVMKMPNTNSQGMRMPASNPVGRPPSLMVR